MSAPLVSIGVPVYNGGETVERALTSLLAQTCGDFELIISDNGSTDQTPDVCRRIAAGDRRIRFVRHAENRGAGFNFRFVLGEARAKYFMWAAADDRWEPRFIEENVKVLEANPNAVGSVSRVHMPGQRQLGTRPLVGGFRQRLRRYMLEPGANSRFYGVFRREALIASLIDREFVAADWAVTINLLRRGEFHEVPELLMERSNDGTSSTLQRQFEQLRVPRWKRMVPLADFTAWLWRSIPAIDFVLLLDILIRLNVALIRAAARERRIGRAPRSTDLRREHDHASGKDVTTSRNA